MSASTTSKKAAKFVRMFDGTEWATYKRGGKKHRAAEARRAAFDAAKSERSALNGEIAKFLRGHGIVPNGRAWAEVREGVTEAGDLGLLTEKNLDRLRKLNAKDNLVFRAPKETAPEVVSEAKPAKQGKKARRKARSAAARKGWETRRANEAARKAAEEAKSVKAEETINGVTRSAFFIALGDVFTKAEKKALWKQARKNAKANA